MPGGLLTRLKRRAHGYGEPSEASAIAEHLRTLLNTRQGSSSLDASYGLADFTDLMHMFPRGLSAMCDGIVGAIERFEPRLQNVEVEPSTRDVDNLIMHFIIRAEVASSGTQVRFDSSMNQSGHVEIR